MGGQVLQASASREGRVQTMHPTMHEHLAADLQRERLNSAERYRQGRLAVKHRNETNLRNGHVDRSVRLWGWVMNQLTWPRWPRPAASPL